MLYVLYISAPPAQSSNIEAEPGQRGRGLSDGSAHSEDATLSLSPNLVLEKGAQYKFSLQPAKTCQHCCVSFKWRAEGEPSHTLVCKLFLRKI